MSNKMADPVSGAQPGSSTDELRSTGSAVRQQRITSAIYAISNAIELCEAAKLPELSDRLLSIQNAALKAREAA